MDYREEKSHDERCKESAAMMKRFADRVPIIVQRRRPNIHDIDKRKFMAPRNLTLAQFTYVIRKRLKLASNEAIFVFVNNKLVTQTCELHLAYEKDKDPDGFLYLTYDFENTFGANGTRC